MRTTWPALARPVIAAALSACVAACGAAASTAIGPVSFPDTGTAPPPSPPIPSPTATGPRLTISTAHGCPAIVMDAGEVASAAPGSGQMLVPPQPQGGLACRYSGWDQHTEQHLLASAQLTTPQAASIAKLLSRLPELHGTVSCPRDTGARDIIVLTYPHHASATVDVHLGGCGTVTNGWFGRISTSGLRTALTAQTGHPASR